MLALKRLVQVVLGTASDNVYLEIQIVLQALLQREYLRLTVDQRQHDNTDSVL